MKIYNWEEILSTLFKYTPQLCSIKTADTKIYQQVNQFFSETFGLAPQHIIGNSLKELLKKNPPLNTPLNQKWLQQIETMDEAVCINKATITHPETIFTDHKGHLQTTILLKSPILNLYNEAIAIVTYADNTTNKHNLLSLWQLYQTHFPYHAAFQKFLNYLEINKYLKELLTEEEIQILLSISLDKNTDQKQALLTTLLFKNIHTNQLTTQINQHSLKNVYHKIK